MDLVILEVFSNLNDSMILWFCPVPPAPQRPRSGELPPLRSHACVCVSQQRSVPAA